ncbi:hypothetical protein FRC08_005708 [Ceratobasidium sp. 394]|nr:hypothetical protein FRC08_005708 [Ceratobasidium sp. 394]
MSDTHNDTPASDAPDLQALSLNERERRRRRYKSKKRRDKQKRSAALEAATQAASNPSNTASVPSGSDVGASMQRKRSATMLTDNPTARMLHLLSFRSIFLMISTYSRPPSPESFSEDLPTEDESQPADKHTRRGMRAGKSVKESRLLARQKQKERYRAKIARQLIEILDALEQPIADEPAHNLTDQEAIDLADGHRVSKERQEIAFDVDKHAKKWREKHNIRPGQFKGKVLTDEQIRSLKFRIFTSGAIWGYRTNEHGEEVLAFSAIFHFFDQMSDSELDDIKFMGEFFTELSIHGPFIDTNSAMEGGLMIGIGWRGGSDEGFRFGWYQRHPDTDWAKYHRDECRVAAIYNRLFLQQSRHIHGVASSVVETHRLPRLSDRQIGENTAEIPASNLTVTWDDFFNKIHTDGDASPWTFGLWFPTYADGKLVRDPKLVEEMTKGGAFALPAIGVAIDFSKCAGVVSILWQGPHELHGTARSETKPGFRRWGSSIQCAKRIVQRVDLHARMLRGELNKQGEPIRKLRINDYYARSSTPRPEIAQKWWVDDMFDEGEEDEGEYEDIEVGMVSVPAEDEVDLDEYDSDVEYESEDN